MCSLTFFLRLNDPEVNNSFSLCVTNGRATPSYGVLHRGIGTAFPKAQRLIDYLVKKGWQLECDESQTIVLYNSVNFPRILEGSLLTQPDGTITVQSRHTIDGHNVVSGFHLDKFGISFNQFFGSYCLPQDKDNFPPLELMIGPKLIHKNTKYMLFGKI
jgi:hypothetical protein